MAEVLFFIAAIGALAGAVGVIFPPQGNPFYSVLALVGHLLSLGALFLLLRAEFIAAAQVVVYAGAVMVLYVFVQAYIGTDEPLASPLAPKLRGFAIFFAGLILVQLCIAVLGSGLKALDGEGAPYDPTPAPRADGNDTPVFGSPEQIGDLLLTKFLLAFELASILLTIAAVGAVVLARRRRGVHPEGDEHVLSVGELILPPGTGSMREAVSGIPEHVPNADDAGTRQIGAGHTTEERGGW
jgi:NADH-quinone oxidoreductase subunit J